jgi:hypothetical protein
MLQRKSFVCPQRSIPISFSHPLRWAYLSVGNLGTGKIDALGPKGRPGASLPVYATAAKSPNPADPSQPQPPIYTQSRRRAIRRHRIRLVHIWPVLSTRKGFKSSDPTTPKPRNTTTFTPPSRLFFVDGKQWCLMRSCYSATLLAFTNLSHLRTTPIAHPKMY